MLKLHSRGVIFICCQSNPVLHHLALLMSSWWLITCFCYALQCFRDEKENSYNIIYSYMCDSWMCQGAVCAWLEDKTKLEDKSLDWGFFVCFFFFPLKYCWTLLWKWHETVGEFVKRCCVQKQQQHSQLSLTLKKEVLKMKCGLFTNPAHGCGKKVHGQPCDSIPITFIHFACVSKSLAVGCVAGDKVILQTSNSELDGTAAHKRNVGDCTKINCKLEN